MTKIESLMELEVYYPETEEYSRYLSQIFSTEAKRKQPSAIVCPRNHQEVKLFIDYANERQLSYTVCGGGLSSLSIENGLVCLALSQYYNKVELTTDRLSSGYSIRVEGGAKVGTIIEELDQVGCHLPVGVSPLPGLGLILRGGIGHLTRSEGLSLDYIRKIGFISVDGEELELFDGCAYPELWSALRGAAPRFGVVSWMELAAVPNNQVTVATFSSNLSSLSRWLDSADKLPDVISASLVLGYNTPRQNEAVLFGYVVNNDISENALSNTLSSVNALLGDGTGINWYTPPQTKQYCQLPAFDIPQLEIDNSEVTYIPFVKSYLINNRYLKYNAQILINAIKIAPNRLCRIDLQHMGGVNKTIQNGSVFKGREADWNLVITGFANSIDDSDRAVIWVMELIQQLDQAICGVYSVEIRPSRSETDTELNLAFGDNLPLLRKISLCYDKQGKFNHYPL
jgi:hypothetical protein